MFGFSDTWQLVINTGKTFLMVFLMQAALLASAPLWQARSARLSSSWVSFSA